MDAQGVSNRSTGRLWMFELDEPQKTGACIKVIGVGGGGGNAINTMIEAGIDSVQFIVANTDKQALAVNNAEVRIQIGEQRTGGLGAGGIPQVGQESAQESASVIQEQLKGADMVFVTAGMGGGTGTGATPIIAGIARQLGALTVAVVTKPFRFEARQRRKQADIGIENLRKNVDALITIPNERLLQTVGEQMSAISAYKHANSVLCDAVRAISELITKTGYINIDFADVRAVMSNQGLALMGTGIGSGQSRATDAAEAAISSPLLDDISIDGASNVLVNITAPSDATLIEINEAVSIIEDAASEDANIIVGHVVSEDDTDEIKITVIATGFDDAEASADDTPFLDRGAKKPDFIGSQIRPDSAYASGSRNPAVASQSGTYSRTAAAASAPSPYQSTVSDNSLDIAKTLQGYEKQANELYSDVNTQNSSSYAPRNASPNSFAPAQSSQQNFAQPRQPEPAAPDIFASVQQNIPQNDARMSSTNKPAVSLNDISDSYDDISSLVTPAVLRKSNKFFLD